MDRGAGRSSHFFETTAYDPIVHLGVQGRRRIISCALLHLRIAHADTQLFENMDVFNFLKIIH